MACLTGAVGMQTLMELADRAPTNEETTLLQSCLDEEEDRALALSSEEPVLDSGEIDSQEEAAGSKLVVEQPNSDDPDENPAESFFARFMNAQMQPRIDAAFDAMPCEGSSENNYPSSYYQVLCSIRTSTYLRYPMILDPLTGIVVVVMGLEG